MLMGARAQSLSLVGRIMILFASLALRNRRDPMGGRFERDGRRCAWYSVRHKVRDRNAGKGIAHQDR